MQPLFPVGVRVPVGSPFIQTQEESSPGRGRKEKVLSVIIVPRAPRRVIGPLPAGVPRDWASPGRRAA